MSPVDALKKDMEEEGDAGGKVDAARDVLSAIADKDASALSMALERHYELCAEGEEEGPESSESERY